jgi:squalene cyclase
MIDTHRAEDYIYSRGSDLEKARVSCVLHGVKAETEVIQRFIELQNDDGGFPFEMHKENLSTINDTTVALWYLEELDLLFSEAARRAFSYLLSTQKADGSWNEDLRINQYELPPWIKLDDPKTILYLSAYATYWLAVGGYSGAPNFRKATHFLIRNQDQSGKFFGYVHTTWIACGFFLLSGDRYRNVAELGIQYLRNQNLSDWDDSQVAWAADCLSKGGLPEDHPFIRDCLSELMQRQKSDGSWSSEDGEAFSVGATIQALKVIKRYSRLTFGGMDDYQG